MVFIDSYYLNKELISQFNSTLGKYVGFSEYGVRSAEFWNNNTAKLQATREQVEVYCKHNAQVYDSVFRDKTGQWNNLELSNQLQYNVILFFKSAISF